MLNPKYIEELAEYHVKVIFLTQGKFTVVDDSVYDDLMYWRWHAFWANGRWLYAGRNEYVNGKWHKIVMHREIMNLTDYKLEIDHINGNGLDNRKSNLLIVTRFQHKQNHKERRNLISYEKFLAENENS